mmetsp:Transcript_26553/g.70461  ORF Transcript_26553/g.70461 Transcript_26553/m.70461 type:complete len:207 (-) Transcript_26553:62-682(-)
MVATPSSHARRVVAAWSSRSARAPSPAPTCRGSVPRAPSGPRAGSSRCPSRRSAPASSSASSSSGSRGPSRGTGSPAASSAAPPAPPGRRSRHSPGARWREALGSDQLVVSTWPANSRDFYWSHLRLSCRCSRGTGRTCCGQCDTMCGHCSSHRRSTAGIGTSSWRLQSSTSLRCSSLQRLCAETQPLYFRQSPTTAGRCATLRRS